MRHCFDIKLTDKRLSPNCCKSLFDWWNILNTVMSPWKWVNATGAPRLLIPGWPWSSGVAHSLPTWSRSVQVVWHLCLDRIKHLKTLIATKFMKKSDDSTLTQISIVTWSGRPERAGRKIRCSRFAGALSMASALPIVYSPWLLADILVYVSDNFWFN